jgi:hypothetical protein
MTTIIIGMIIGIIIAHAVAAGMTNGPRFPGDRGYVPSGPGFFKYLLMLAAGAGLGAIIANFI